MASVHKDTSGSIQPYITALAGYGKTLPSSGGPGFRQPGVTIRNGRLPNQAKIPTSHPSGRPPAEHYVKMILGKMTGVSYKPKAEPGVHVKYPVVHPGKALHLRSVKAIHLGHPTVKKVSA